MPTLLPPSPLPSVHADDVGEGARDGEGDELEKPDEPTSPLFSAVAVVKPQLPPSVPTPAPKKRPGRRKKNPLTPRQRAIACRRLENLTCKFHPLPFFPGKTLDFSAHEDLFRELGLWDFAHIKLDSKVRSDLLVDLISYYDPSNHRSYVHGIRIAVSRSHLARALELPAKKVKALPLECMDEAAVCVLLEFISNYTPYGDRDDMCILPPEVMQAIQFIREGQPQKVDWAALMWVLVEKDLLDAPNSGNCHCASHLQCLIKHQQPFLFKKEKGPVLEPIVEADEDEILVVEAEGCVADRDGNVVEDKANVSEEEDAYNDNTMKMRTLEDLENTFIEKNNGMLPLPLGKEENMMGGFEEEGGDEELLEVKIECYEHCTYVVTESTDVANITKVGEQKEQEMMHGNDLSSNFSNLVKLSPTDFQAMGNTTYGQQLNSFNAPCGVFLTVGTDSHKNGLTGNNGKRFACAMNDLDEDYFGLNHGKRMRSSEPWGDMPLSPYDLMGQMQANAERVKMLYAEKAQALINMQNHSQNLSHAFLEKEQAIRSLKVMIEKQQHGRMVHRYYEHKLDLMKKMRIGYKKLLKDTLINFANYKRKHSQYDDTLCKDVSGTSGLVLSVKEIKQQRVTKEEACQKLLGTAGLLEKVLMKFKECEECIMMHNMKLAKLAGEVKQLKERFVKSNSPSI